MYRKIYCRIVRREEGRLAMEFAENDLVTEAIVQDLMFYQARARKRNVSANYQDDLVMTAIPETAGS